jgi:nitrite reductase/ring-hydroxylating ferredoxin subunit
VSTPPAFPIAAAAERRLDRRRFLRTAGAAAAFVLAGEWAGRRLAERAGPSGDAITVRLDDGTAVTWDRRCPHLGCPVVWVPERARLECPCHRAAFDPRTGAVLSGPPQRGLRRLDSREV